MYGRAQRRGQANYHRPVCFIPLFCTFLLNLFKDFFFTLYCIFSGVVAEVCMAEERVNIDCPVFYLPALYIYS